MKEDDSTTNTLCASDFSKKTIEAQAIIEKNKDTNEFATRVMKKYEEQEKPFAYLGSLYGATESHVLTLFSVSTEKYVFKLDLDRRTNTLVLTMARRDHNKMLPKDYNCSEAQRLYSLLCRLADNEQILSVFS